MLVKRKLVLEFTKMNGAGNDFVVLDNRFYAFTPEELSPLARDLCRRTEAVGADGLLALAPADEEAHDFRMLYFNADGSRATMCGNGARCLARFARQAGFDRDRLTFETDAGLYRADVLADAEADVTIHVPPPRDFRTVSLDHEAACYVWTGTEHAVLFCDDVRMVPVAQRGARLRHDPSLAPAGANINFVEVLDAERNLLRVRTFEKGVEAETRACGTGALASALAALFTGRIAALPATVEMPGGRLVVSARRTGATTVEALSLSGPAEITFRGSVDRA